MNTDLAAQRALDRRRDKGFANLTETERTVLAVWLFEARVANGGFANFFRSEAGDVAFYAPEALQRIGALNLADIAAQANAVFPNGPSPNHEERLSQTDALPAQAKQQWAALEQRFFDRAEETDELLERYLRANKGAEMAE